MITIEIPLNDRIKPRSPNRRSNHWAPQYKENKRLKNIIHLAFLADFKADSARKLFQECQDSLKKENAPEPKFNLLVTICYVRPREFDDDNLISSLKGVRDTIAGIIKPGLRPGHADKDKAFKFVCSQEQRNAHEYALKITIQKIPISQDQTDYIIQKIDL